MEYPNIEESREEKAFSKKLLKRCHQVRRKKEGKVGIAEKEQRKAMARLNKQMRRKRRVPVWEIKNLRTGRTI